MTSTQQKHDISNTNKFVKGKPYFFNKTARTVKAFTKMPSVVVFMVDCKYKSEFVMWPFQNFTKMLAEQLKFDNERPLSITPLGHSEYL